MVKVKSVRNMAKASLTKNNPLGGGSERSLRLGAGVVLKIAPLRGSLGLDEYKHLARYREYLSADYCIVCAYFHVIKGHFGTCPDLPMRKAYDGTKKGSGCALWRLQTIYLRYGIKQKLPEKPTIRRLELRVTRRRARACRRPIPKWLFSHPISHRSKDVETPWFWHWRLTKEAYDLARCPESLPDSIDLREPYGHYSDKLVWKDGKYRSKKLVPIIKTCCQCGKEFEQQGNTKGLYCSQVCFHEHRKAELAKSHNHIIA